MIDISPGSGFGILTNSCVMIISVGVGTKNIRVRLTSRARSSVRVDSALLSHNQDYRA